MTKAFLKDLRESRDNLGNMENKALLTAEDVGRHNFRQGELSILDVLLSEELYEDMIDALMEGEHEE